MKTQAMFRIRRLIWTRGKNSWVAKSSIGMMTIKKEGRLWMLYIRRPGLIQSYEPMTVVECKKLAKKLHVKEVMKWLEG